MIQRQREIRDTHPDIELIVEWDDVVAADDRVHTCVAASIGGVPVPDPAALYAQVHAENVAKNQAVEAIRLNAPAEMLKPSLDDDNDPVLDESGEAVMVVKNKFPVLMTPTPLGEPTLLAIDGIDPAHAAKLLAAVGDKVALRLTDRQGRVIAVSVADIEAAALEVR